MCHARIVTKREKLKSKRKMKNYKLTSKKELDEIAFKKHPVELDASGYDKNNFVRQVFINGYLLGMKAIIELN